MVMNITSSFKNSTYTWTTGSPCGSCLDQVHCDCQWPCPNIAELQKLVFCCKTVVLVVLSETSACPAAKSLSYALVENFDIELFLANFPVGNAAAKAGMAGMANLVEDQKNNLPFIYII